MSGDMNVSQVGHGREHLDVEVKLRRERDRQMVWQSATAGSENKGRNDEIRHPERFVAAQAAYALRMFDRMGVRPANTDAGRGERGHDHNEFQGP